MIDVTVVIPCRAGSTRVVNKNFRPFADTSLLEIKINQAKKLNLPVIVNSDSSVAKEMADNNNVGFVQRPEYYASSECNNSEYYDYLGSSVDSEYIMILQPTAPLLNDDTLLDTLETFNKSIDEYDSLMTVQMLKKHTWFKGQPLNYELKNTPNSQNLEPVMFPTFNVMIVKVSSLLESKNVITDKCLFFEVSDEESIEIDDVIEFEMAEYFYKKKYESI